MTRERVDLGVGPEVVQPRGVLRAAAVRRDDDEVVAVRHVLDELLAALPRLRAGHRDEHHRPALELAPEPATTRLEHPAMHREEDLAEPPLELDRTFRLHRSPPSRLPCLNTVFPARAGAGKTQLGQGSGLGASLVGARARARAVTRRPR